MKNRCLGVIGHPISHSLSPPLHRFLIEKNDLDFSYHAFDVRPDRLEEAVRGAKALGFRGLNVTTPHKIHVMDFVDELGEEAEKIGAVNTLIFEEEKIIGRNTDAEGFLQSLAMENLSLQDRQVFILGAGGAARAISFAANSAGAEKIFISNRTLEKAEILARDFNAQTTIPEEIKTLPGGGVVVNATSLGMSPKIEARPLPPALFRRELVYVDLVYNPPMTVFLDHAQKIGAKSVGGLGMLICQGAASLSFWANKSISLAREDGSLRSLLRNNFH